MNVIELALEQKNALASDYITGNENVSQFFDYSFQHQSEFRKRYEEIKNRSFPREELVNHLIAYNKKYSSSETVIENIRKLKQEDSVAVIGGQQAGILTGPLYSIHKCISVIQFAKKQEEALGVPVVPIFWIAGEDHDFDEINHTYVYSAGKLEKRTIPQTASFKQSVSEMKLDKKDVGLWMDSVVKTFGETKDTKELLRLLHRSLRDSETFVDLFAHLLSALFQEYGLVLLDSGDPELRKIESPYFKEMIEHNESISGAVTDSLSDISGEGYAQPLDMEDGNANLFFHINGERVLLERDGQDWYRGKNNECLLSREELLEAAEQHPHTLSNNVVTRPLMQEMLFPTLAFIAGPGEIAYWAALRGVFHQFERKVPPLVPRLNVTFVDSKTERWLEGKDLSLETVLTKGVFEAKEKWFQQHKSLDIEHTVRQTKQAIEHAHQDMRNMAEQIDGNLNPIAESNLRHIYSQVDYFSDKIDRSLRFKYEKELARFDDTGALLFPHNQPQERIWNLFYFINWFGFDVIPRLLTKELNFNGNHHVIIL